jgi:hypothetical protein
VFIEPADAGQLGVVGELTPRELNEVRHAEKGEASRPAIW